MSPLLRKISRAKWEKGTPSEAAAVCADAITGCSRTSRDTLSLWYSSDAEETKMALLAIFGSLQTIDAIDIIVIDEAAVAERGLAVVATEGKSAGERLSVLHRDLVDLNYRKLGLVAEIILGEVRSKRVERWSVKKIIGMLRAGVKDRIVEEDLLQDKVREKIAPS